MGACDLSTEPVPRGACVEVRVEGASVGSDHRFVVGLDECEDAFRDVYVHGAGGDPTVEEVLEVGMECHRSIELDVDFRVGYFW